MTSKLYINEERRPGPAHSCRPFPKRIGCSARRVTPNDQLDRKRPLPALAAPGHLHRPALRHDRRRRLPPRRKGTVMTSHTILGGHRRLATAIFLSAGGGVAAATWI